MLGTAHCVMIFERTGKIGSIESTVTKQTHGLSDKHGSQHNSRSPFAVADLPRRLVVRPIVRASAEVPYAAQSIITNRDPGYDNSR